MIKICRFGLDHKEMNIELLSQFLNKSYTSTLEVQEE